MTDLPIISTSLPRCSATPSTSTIMPTVILLFNAIALFLTAAPAKTPPSKAVTTVSILWPRSHSCRIYQYQCCCGVDTLRFSPGSRSGNYLLYTGRLSHGKGLLDLIEAVAPVLRKRPIKLKLCGDGELRSELEKAAEHYDVRDSVQFMGVLDHERLSEIYSNATVFIFPSRYEGMPTSVLEAMSSGLPVIASDIAAHRQIRTGRRGV